MILIYSEKITPRLDYISRLIFSEILKTEIHFTADSSEFLNSNFPKLNYSNYNLNDGIYLKPHKLLFQKVLEVQDIKEILFNSESCFFESSADSVFPFDILAASFYIVSRYEEYLETGEGKYNRYPDEKSILVRYNLVKKPVINIWANILAAKFQEKYPHLIFPKRRFEFLSTIDVDSAWAFLHKGFFRTTGALAKAVLKGNFSELNRRIRVLSGKEKDPFDSFEYLNNEFKANEDKVRFFFLLGDYNRYDKNISFRNKHFQKLIRRVASKYKTGIHPSFFSGQNPGEDSLQKEIERLRNITEKKIELSRQHFLLLQFPRIYQNLINVGIREDFTMGFPSVAGFRAGVCVPFYFYDLEKEETTNLRIVPFEVMDVTLRDYMKLSPEKAWKEIEGLMTEVKNVGGTFSAIWHNETVTDLDDWKGYREVFEKMNRLGFKWANE